jgi:SOS response associated peptidase (SRAP)
MRAFHNQVMIASTIESGPQRMAALEQTVIKDITVVPEGWYGGQLHLPPPASGKASEELHDRDPRRGRCALDGRRRALRARGALGKLEGSRNEPMGRTFTILTTEASELVATLQDRMPAIVAAEDRDHWLTDADPADLMRPLSSEPE